MNTVTIKIDGLDTLRKALLDLPDRLASNSLQSAVGAGAAIIRDQARSNAPVWTGEVSRGHPPPGTLKRSIVTKKIQELSTYYRKTWFVTVRRGKKYQKQGKKGNLSQDAFYWSWVEFGHYYAPKTQGMRAGARRRQMQAVAAGTQLVSGSMFVPAHPFMRPAFDAKKGAAVDAITAKLRERIAQHAAELKR